MCHTRNDETYQGATIRQSCLRVLSGAAQRSCAACSVSQWAGLNAVERAAVQLDRSGHGQGQLPQAKLVCLADCIRVHSRSEHCGVARDRCQLDLPAVPSLCSGRCWQVSREARPVLKQSAVRLRAQRALQAAVVAVAPLAMPWVGRGRRRGLASDTVAAGGGGAWWGLGHRRGFAGDRQGLDGTFGKSRLPQTAGISAGEAGSRYFGWAIGPLSGLLGRRQQSFNRFVYLPRGQSIEDQLVLMGNIQPAGVNGLAFDRLRRGPHNRGRLLRA